LCFKITKCICFRKRWHFESQILLFSVFKTLEKYQYLLYIIVCQIYICFRFFYLLLIIDIHMSCNTEFSNKNLYGLTMALLLI
jgi:hypothetical protein